MNISGIDITDSCMKILENQLDITAPVIVEVLVNPSSTGPILHINVNGVCALRCCRIGTITIEDNRS